MPWGGGAALIDCQGTTVTGNLIVGNLAISGGGGVYCQGASTNTLLVNNTIASNKADTGGGGLYNDLASPAVTNCIVWDNVSSPGAQIHNTPGAAPTLRACDVQDGLPPGCIDAGENIDADPAFADPGHWDDKGTPDLLDDEWVRGDCHLQSPAGRWDPTTQQWVTTDTETSPCIDSGDPATPVGDEPTPNGGRINQGAYGGTAEASKTAGPASIARSPASLAPECDEGQSAAADTIEIWNAGGETLDYSIADDVAWISSIEPALGSSVGQHNDHTVHYASSAVQPGVHAGQITIAGNAANSPQQVAVTLTVNNVLPTVTIDDIQPNPADPRQEAVHFHGTAQDAVGVITRHEWRSDIDGVLGDQEDCLYPLDTISVGTHQITFEAWDDDGTSRSVLSAVPLVVGNAEPVAEIVSVVHDPSKPSVTFQIVVAGHDQDEKGASIADGELRVTDPDGGEQVIHPALPGAHFVQLADWQPGACTFEYRVQDDEGSWSSTASHNVILVELLLDSDPWGLALAAFSLDPEPVETLPIDDGRLHAIYAQGTQVAITAQDVEKQEKLYRFDYWTGDVPTGHESDNPLTLVVDSGKSLVGVFLEFTPPADPGPLEIDTTVMTGGKLNPNAPAPRSLGILAIGTNNNPPETLYAIRIGPGPGDGWLHLTGSEAVPGGPDPDWHTAGEWQDTRLRGLSPGQQCDFHAQARNAAWQTSALVPVGTPYSTNEDCDVNRSGFVSGLDYALIKACIIHGIFKWPCDVDDSGALDATDLGNTASRFHGP